MNELVLFLIETLEPKLQGPILERFRTLQLHGLDDSPFNLLSETLQDFPKLENYPLDWWLDPHLCRWWLCLFVDWKASYDVEFEIQAIARTLGLSDGYFWDSKQQPLQDTSVMEVLEHASDWLRWQEHALMLLETDGDEYMALVIHTERLEQVRILLERAGISSSLV